MEKTLLYLPVQQLRQKLAYNSTKLRVFFIDKKGRKPDGVYTGVILAKEILKNSYIKHNIYEIIKLLNPKSILATPKINHKEAKFI